MLPFVGQVILSGRRQPPCSNVPTFMICAPEAAAEQPGALLEQFVRPASGQYRLRALAAPMPSARQYFGFEVVKARERAFTLSRPR